MRLLCFSDIHGHADALAAVLASAEKRGYDSILVAGDLCFPGPAPLATWRRLRQLGAVCVQGVSDRALASLDPDALEPRDDRERTRLQRLRETRAELGPAILEHLATLPPIHRATLVDGTELLLVHGSPADPTEAMTHDLTDAALRRLLSDEPAGLVLCGCSHVPFDRFVPLHDGATEAEPGWRIVNLGSVGEAPGADGPDGPFAHATFVECSVDGIEIQQFLAPLG